MHNAYALMHAFYDRFHGIVLSGSRVCRAQTAPSEDTSRSNANIIGSNNNNYWPSKENYTNCSMSVEFILM